MQIWQNMNRSAGELARKRLLGNLWLVVVCFFNTVPLFIISVLANLDSVRYLDSGHDSFPHPLQLRVYVPFLDEWANASPNSFAFVSGVLPPAVSGIFGFFLPIIMRWLTRASHLSYHSEFS